MIKSSTVKITNTNSKYMDLILSDKTGEVNGKWWGYQEKEGEAFTAGTLIKTRGMVTDWRGKLQYRIDRIRCTENSDDVNPEDFVLSAPIDPEDMFQSILQYVETMENRDIKEIVSCTLKEKQEKLMHYPAAMKNHHSIRSGLLYHILTMLKMAERTCQVYLNLNKDLLYGGVILHDLEKINEMDSNELGIVSGYTVEGTLLGHIIQGIKSLERIGEEVGADPELVILLQHMLLSHHYEPEFGSPKRPMIPEAEILHYLDVMDARMYDMQKELDGIEEGEFSDRVWVLHNRQIYKYKPEDGK
ncbi:MAG TPA: HD domain-containing protein [Clostridia bacterium]|nr:HD domain-containing protein [Clostridia bacterium]